jgi:hypothetical protein
MTTFQIRLIAIIAMIIDHIGLFFFPQIIIFRIIGRISFPLFAWLIANGARYSRNNDRYLKRLFTLACLSQIPFTIANVLVGNNIWYFNVIFTLSLGLVAIILINKSKEDLTKILVVSLVVVVSYLFNTDYSFVGVLSIICFYYFHNSPQRNLLLQSIIFSSPLILYTIKSLFNQGFVHLEPIYFDYFFGLLTALACIYFYNGREGLKAKYLFYLFYPVQYTVIIILLLKFIK